MARLPAEGREACRCRDHRAMLMYCLWLEPAMSAQDPIEFTTALQAAADGDRQAADQLLPQVYEELRRLARARLATLTPGQTLQATELVAEAYLRLTRDGDPGWNGRGHFFGAAGRAMREILIEHARRRSSVKRGHGRRRVDLADADLTIEPPADDLLALDEALQQLEADDPRKVEIVNLRFFAGLTAQEAADTLGISLGTVEREWRYVRAWLYTRLADAR